MADRPEIMRAFVFPVHGTDREGDHPEYALLELTERDLEELEDKESGAELLSQIGFAEEYALEAFNVIFFNDNALAIDTVTEVEPALFLPKRGSYTVYAGDGVYPVVFIKLHFSESEFWFTAMTKSDSESIYTERLSWEMFK